MSRVECDHCGARYELPSEAQLEPNAGVPATCRECGAPARISAGDHALSPAPVAVRDKVGDDEIETGKVPATAEIAKTDKKDAVEEEPETARSPSVYADVIEDEKTVAIPLNAKKPNKDEEPSSPEKKAESPLEAAAPLEATAPPSSETATEKEDEAPPISATPSMETLIQRVRLHSEPAGKSSKVLEAPRYDLRPPDIQIEDAPPKSAAPSTARPIKTDAPVAGTRPPPPRQPSSRAGLIAMVALSAGGIYFAARGVQNNDGSSASAVEPPPPTLNEVTRPIENRATAAEPAASAAEPAPPAQPTATATGLALAPAEPKPDTKRPLGVPPISRKREEAVVPVSMPAEPANSDAARLAVLPPADAAFDSSAANAALETAAAQASTCRRTGDPSGTATVTITFSTSGRVTSATISGPPFAGTETGSCIASRLRGARVPAFAGEFITVKKTVAIQ
jgi:hypothetical protein